MFIDKVSIKVTAGKGGDGTTAFRREKYVPRGGPDGGDGGKGADIIFESSIHLSTLLELKYNKKYKADDGGKGMPKKAHGKSSKDLVIKVPVGTTILNAETNRVIADLTHDGQRAVIAAGGRGGRGNYRFMSSRNTAPDISELGEPGQSLEVVVELKLLADVGLVGFPSVGKSTILSVVSKAKPVIADYHFTTIVPNLGVVEVKDGRSFVLADLPGLIEGASQGKGLGHQFLRHIERCRVILHVLDMGSVESRNPIEDFRIINEELKHYKYRLSERPQLVVANKMDLPDATMHLAAFKLAYPEIEVFPVSAITHEGMDAVLYRTANLLLETPEFILEEEEHVVLYEFDDTLPFKIENKGNGEWLVKGEKVEKYVAMTSFSSDDAVKRLALQLREVGLDDALRAAGIQSGDTVTIADFHFEFME